MPRSGSDETKLDTMLAHIKALASSSDSSGSKSANHSPKHVALLQRDYKSAL